MEQVSIMFRGNKDNALGVVLFVYDIMLMSKLTQTTLKELYCLLVRFFLS